jgi:cytochrome c-type biogenesis protein CcmH
MASFLVLAALMLAAALAFVLPTLLRGDKHSTRLATLTVAVLLPVCAVLLYRYVGNPGALEPGALVAPADHGQEIEQAIAELAAKLKKEPNDVQGWILLGRAYEAMERFADSLDALKHAHELKPEDADLTVAYAQAMALATDSHRIVGEARALIEGVLKTAPDNERALWLLGISDFQDKRYDAAIAGWKHLLAALPKDSDIGPTVQQEIAQAEAERDGRQFTPQATAAVAPAASGPRLQVEVTLDPALKDKLAANDVLFIYAKAASGPPMPLAVQRLPADKLPVTVVLTDGMGMLPSMKLSQFPQVIVGARVSKSGAAIAQSGDLQTVSAPLAVSTTTPIKLTIDSVVP